VIREKLKEYPCIVPLRHPVSVAESWIARADPNRRHVKIEELCDYWRRLITVVDPFRPYYLPIDRPEREARLQAINDGLGLELKTDWPVWKSCGIDGHLSDADLEMTFDMMEELEITGRFGYGQG